jgi:radical SAM superfamily enzyme YgiQ (UPF0313 family)
MKIGFIAMSGVRAHNAELTKLGLTLPGFVNRNKIIASMPSLGLLTLAALTPERFAIEYIEVVDLKSAEDLRADWDLVAISTFSAQACEAYELADKYRGLGITVVMGGLHVTAMPEEAKQHCDAVVIGEGEPIWPELLADAERGELKEFYRSAEYGLYDLAQAPIPRFDLLDPTRYNRLTIQTSRGCPHKCSFCASSILLTSRYKTKPVAKILDEIHAIKSIWSKPFIEFADDNTFVNTRHSKELLRALLHEDVRWFTETDISVANDDELLGLMRDSGCQQILIGLESPRKASLEGIELKGNWKLRKVDQYKAAIEKIQSYGITVNGCFILGLDGDTPEVFDEVLTFVRESGLYEVQVTFLTAFPNTPLYHQLKAEGRLVRDNAWELCTLFDINFEPRSMTRQQLQDGFLRLVKVLYSAEETRTRRMGFKRRLKNSPNFGHRARKLAPMGVRMDRAVDVAA